MPYVPSVALASNLTLFPVDSGQAREKQMGSMPLLAPIILTISVGSKQQQQEDFPHVGVDPRRSRNCD